MEQIKAGLIRAFWMILAIVFLIESWIWDHVRDGLRALGRRLGVERIDPWLRTFVARLAPPMTLVLFGVPAVLIFPFKLIALGLLAEGYIFSGAVAIFAAKSLALGVTAVLFDICREKLMQMPWFCRFYSLMLAAGAWSHELVSPLRRRVVAITARLRQRLAPLKDRILLAGRSGVGRRLSRLRAWSARVMDRSGQRDEV